MSKVSIVLPYNIAGFLPDEIVVWLDTYVGEVINSHKSCAVGLGWCLRRVENTGFNVTEIYTFEIDDPTKAMLFKLTFG